MTETDLNFACLSTRRCRRRDCVYCSTANGNRIGRNIYNRTTDSATYYHIVLTLPLSIKTAAEQTTDLISAFNALRRKAEWNKNIKGGIRKIEAKKNQISGLWRCHLHVFAEATTELAAIDISTIQFHWLMLAGAQDSEFKLIDSADYRENCSYYIAKAPQSDLFANTADLEDFISQTKGRRLIATFGNYTKQPLYQRRGKPSASIKSNRSTTLQVTPISDSKSKIDINMLRVGNADDWRKPMLSAHLVALDNIKVSAAPLSPIVQQWNALQLDSS